MAYRAFAYKESFYKDKGREPAIEEIADYLQTSTYIVSNAMESVNPAMSLYDPAYSDEADGMYLMDTLPAETFEDMFISKTIIENVLHNLEKRDKIIMNLRFMQGKTQTQVADIVGISQAQVSRIEKNIISSVKKQLEI